MAAMAIRAVREVSLLRAAGCVSLQPVRGKKGLRPPKPDKRPVFADQVSWAKRLVEWKEETLSQKEGSATQEPHRLHAVYRIKTLKNRPFWEKNIMTELGLVKKYKFQVHKNCPSVNKKLSQVKHLVCIVPVSLPHGMPEDESDFEYTQLKSNGEFIVNKKIKALTESSPCVDYPTLCESDPTYMDKVTMQKEMRRKLDDYEINWEYVKPDYKYKYNQDGKEYRYRDLKK